MKNLKHILLSIPLFFSTSFFSGLQAQDNITINGTVTDENNVPIPGVNVLEKGTTNGTQTDFDGKYALSGVGKGHVIAYSYIGYESKEFSVGSTNVINVTLSESTELLDEVVVIGYGSVKKSDLTGAVSSIGEDDFNQGINTSVDQSIAGRVAGVQISQNSSEPGGGSSVRIRGSNSVNAGNDPLYVIDGLPINNSPVITGTGAGVVNNASQRNPLNSLNPNDIESIEVLKDASATAIYGSRGANGVIIITTKKGTSGRTRIEYSLQTGVQSAYNFPRLLDARELATSINEIRVAEGGEPPRNLSTITNDTDYFKEITRPGFTQNHNLSFSGGSDGFNYNVSLNYFGQEGVIISSGLDRYTGRLNLAKTFSEKFRIGTNFSVSVIENDFVPFGSTQIGPGIVNATFQYDPSLAPRDEDGNPLEVSPSEFEISNPLAIADIHTIGKDKRTYGNFYAEYFLLPELSAKVNFGFDLNNARRDNFNTFSKSENVDDNIAGIISNEDDSYLVEATLQYNRSFENHSIGAVGGYSYQKFNQQGVSASARFLPADVVLANNLSLGDEIEDSVDSFKNQNFLISYLGRINYSAFNKYLLTIAFRADGSSRFGKNNKFGYFPSAALAWKVNEENFLKDSKIVNDLKLRGSYGITGNQDIGNYSSLAQLAGGGIALLNEVQLQGINSELQAANPDLKWEQTKQLDIGVDFSLFNNRISGTVDYYEKYTSDLLLADPLPRTTGFSNILRNIGSVENKGFEFLLDTRNIVSENFYWNSTFNFSTYKNVVTKLGINDSDIIVGNLPFTQGISVVRVGEPLGAYYGNIVEGIFQETDDIENSAQPNAEPGFPIFRDLDGDDDIDGDDRAILGSPVPDFTFGVNNTIGYKNLQLDVFVAGEIGAEILGQNLVQALNPIDIGRNRLAIPVLDRWTPSNTDTRWPSGVNIGNSAYRSASISSLAIQDASFVRLKNVRLSYDLDTENIKGLNNAKVYVGGENLLTWTNDYIGFDPEVNNFGNSSIRVDFNAYPMTRTFIIGLNLGF